MHIVVCNVLLSKVIPSVRSSLCEALSDIAGTLLTGKFWSSACKIFYSLILAKFSHSEVVIMTVPLTEFRISSLVKLCQHQKFCYGLP